MCHEHSFCVTFTACISIEEPPPTSLCFYVTLSVYSSPLTDLNLSMFIIEAKSEPTSKILAPQEPIFQRTLRQHALQLAGKLKT